MQDIKLVCARYSAEVNGQLSDSARVALPFTRTINDMRATASDVGGVYGSVGVADAKDAGGKAVNLNGCALTWVEGNNSTQVRGAVS